MILTPHAREDMVCLAIQVGWVALSLVITLLAAWTILGFPGWNVSATEMYCHWGHAHNTNPNAVCIALLGEP